MDALGSRDCLVHEELEVQFIDVISGLKGNMKHSRAIEFG